VKLASLALLTPFTLLAFAAPAAAAPGPDLSTAIAPPAPTLVKTTSRYTFTVTNVGNKNATGASVAIALPPTHTSPQVYVLGQVIGASAGCSLAGTTLTCTLGTINRGTAKSVWIDLQLQVSAAPLVFTATASAAGDSNPANDSASHTASVLYHQVTAPIDGIATNRHCTGTGLTAWYECTLFPSSISQHDAEFHAGGTITFPDQPDYSGTWSQSGPDQLSFTYYELGTPVATFSGRGAGASCFEGLTTFGSPYVAPYEVCF
jgi:hypothetical protein